MNKTKEFWIKITSFENVGMGAFRYTDCEISVDPDCGKNYSDFKNAIHVIEYAAYEQLKVQAEKMAEALKFYSLKSNYSIVDEGRNYDVDYKCYELDSITYADTELGTKAREALKQWEDYLDKPKNNLTE